MVVFVLTTNHGDVARVIECSKRLTATEVKKVTKRAWHFNQELHQASVARVKDVDGVLAAIDECNPSVEDDD